MFLHETIMLLCDNEVLHLYWIISILFHDNETKLNETRQQTALYQTQTSLYVCPTELACVPLSSCYFVVAQNVDLPQSRFILPTNSATPCISKSSSECTY